MRTIGIVGAFTNFLCQFLRLGGDRVTSLDQVSISASEPTTRIRVFYNLPALARQPVCAFTLLRLSASILFRTLAGESAGSAPLALK